MDKSQKSLFETEPDPWTLDASSEQQVAEIVFADPPHGPFSYRIPATLRAPLAPGQRVQVPLGKGNRGVIGYCLHAGSKSVGSRPLKEVLAVVDPQPLLSPAMLRLAQWMAEYYLCPLGQVLHAVLPAGVRGQAGTREMTFLSVPDDVALKLDQLKLPTKQLDALRILAASPRPLTPPELAAAAKCTLGPISELRKKKLLRAQVQRIQNVEIDIAATPREENLHLNVDQQAALDVIIGALERRQHRAVLMHGVTGSGKTEVYIRAIDEVIRFGRQAIVLVPEISLTPQTKQRFSSRFGSVAVLHSHLSDAERHWHWQRIARGEVQVVIGARSAVFAPTPQLGLIVIDEEHDHSFKQGESPRYHARDVAQRRALAENVPLVLGSATPALESWQAAQRGEFLLIDMPTRVSNRPLPDVATIDLRTEFQDRRSRGAISRPLHLAMEHALREDGQVILLLNRRGFSTHIQCPSCGYVANCPHCSIALTHHREGDKIVCHYCDHQERAPAKCPDCKFDGIRYSGLGTERLEAEVKSRFANVPVLRMDSDTMQKPGSHEQALAKFRAGEIKILLGTQMIAKGLDFPNVTLVGVVNADTSLHFPDFRAAERTFQLVTQVAGRTGRGDKGGRVLVQTFSPEHFAIQAALKHDYALFANTELPVRLEHAYPPQTSLVRLIVRGDEESIVEAFAEQTAERFRQALELHQVAHRVLGPAPCPIARLRGKFRFHALISSAHGEPLRQCIAKVAASLQAPAEVQWVLDVDPLDLL
ncbi:Primosomal protein N' [Anatilimnocola aggregata]|uniref:Replication restart protein PriA n=1 Tax=Anatilimnocola aggregata TaxID=2528021 RepID=A0A517YAW6_9BACT|nr:primosomal protein N' [Anatilimnocola aggregata]QDU27378.1 Primosomal protein N' [Anatilimnocola aggregata]